MAWTRLHIATNGSAQASLPRTQVPAPTGHGRDAAAAQHQHCRSSYCQDPSPCRSIATASPPYPHIYLCRCAAMRCVTLRRSLVWACGWRDDDGRGHFDDDERMDVVLLLVVSVQRVLCSECVYMQCSAEEEEPGQPSVGRKDEKAMLRRRRHKDLARRESRAASIDVNERPMTGHTRHRQRDSIALQVDGNTTHPPPSIQLEEVGRQSALHAIQAADPPVLCRL